MPTTPPPPTRPANVSNHEPTSPLSHMPWGPGKLLAWGELMLELIIAQVAMALGNIEVLGVHPLAFLTTWGQNLEQKASDAYVTATGTRDALTGKTNSDQTDINNYGTNLLSLFGGTDFLTVPVDFVLDVAESMPVFGPIVDKFVNMFTRGAGVSGSTGFGALDSVIGDFTGLLGLGSGSGLGSGAVTLPIIGDIPVLGGLLNALGSELLGGLIPALDASKITSGFFDQTRILDLPTDLANRVLIAGTEGFQDLKDRLYFRFTGAGSWTGSGHLNTDVEAAFVNFFGGVIDAPANVANLSTRATRLTQTMQVLRGDVITAVDSYIQGMKNWFDAQTWHTWTHT